MTTNLAFKPLTESKPLKLTIERDALLKALAKVQSVVERRTTIPILSNVMISADQDSIQLSATDMDLDIVVRVEAQVTEPGATTISAQTFYDIVRKLPDGTQVVLDNTDNAGRLSVTAGRSRFTLATLPIEEFPSSSQTSYSHTFTMTTPQLRDMMDSTRFAISTEDTRYYLNGLFVHTKEVEGVKVLRAVATDGHRLARLEMPSPEGAFGMPEVIIPRKTVFELRKLLDEAGDEVSLSLSENRVQFVFGQTVLSSKLIDGSFPDYEKVIPAGNDRTLDVETKALALATDRVSTIASDKTRAIKLTTEAKKLTLSASSPEYGSATEELEVGYDSESMDIGFNSRYLLDCLQQIEGESTQILLQDGASPAIVQDPADKSVLYVLMPMRV